MQRVKGRLQASACGIAIAGMMLLSSCKKDVKKINNPSIHDQEIHSQYMIILDKVMQQEALLVNVPIPLYNDRILPLSLDALESKTIALGYSSSLTVQQLNNFFVTQMELYGWELLTSFNNVKTILFFKNPSSYATIIIKSLKNNESAIFIYLNKESEL